MKMFSASNSLTVCAILATAVGTYTITSLLLTSPTCTLVNEGLKELDSHHHPHLLPPPPQFRGTTSSRPPSASSSTASSAALPQQLPLCPVVRASNDDDNEAEPSYTKGTWIHNHSISSYPYIGGEDYEWGPRCTDMEKEYLVTGAVPEFLKYTWQPESCDLARFDKQRVCQILDGKTIGIIGDSMQQQFAHSFVGLMLGHLPHNFTHPVDYSQPKQVMELCPYNEHSVTMIFVRWNKYQATEEDRKVLTDLAQESDYLLMNWGVHYQPWNEMESTSKDFIKVLEEHWQPSQNKQPQRLFWRSTIVAHDNCAASTGPLASTENAFHKNPNYNTDEIMLQDKMIVQPLLKSNPKLDVTFLRIEKSTIMRSDGHRVVGHHGSEDCLHYCEPGPTDSWVELFYHHVVMGI